MRRITFPRAFFQEATFVNMASLRKEARIKQPDLMMKLSNLLYRGVTPFGPLLWQAEADIEMTLPASPVPQEYAKRR